MHPIIQQLRDEHQKIRSLLDQINVEILGWRIEEQLQTKLYRLMELFQHMIDYPDKRHHPVEEIIFEVLSSKSVNLNFKIEDLRQQHAMLTYGSLRILEKLGLVSLGMPCDLNTIKSQVSEYMDDQLKHMQKEEDEAFPLIDKTLDLFDWEIITKQIQSAYTKHDHQGDPQMHPQHISGDARL